MMMTGSWAEVEILGLLDWRVRVWMLLVLITDGRRDFKKCVKRFAASLLEVKIRIVGAEAAWSMAALEG
jgi:hypothetical protein